MHAPRPQSTSENEHSSAAIFVEEEDCQRRTQSPEDDSVLASRVESSGTSQSSACVSKCGERSRVDAIWSRRKHKSKTIFSLSKCVRSSAIEV